MIGEMVKFKDYCDEVYISKVVGIFSDKHENVKFLDKNVVYWSKKGKKYPLNYSLIFHHIYAALILLVIIS